MMQAILQKIAAELFAAITTIAGYPEPAWLPEMYRVPHSQIEAMACERPCAVRAMYVPQLGIFLDADLDVEHDLYAKSILLHELVHHAQALRGNFDSLDWCRGWIAAEREAYAAQDVYLHHSEPAVRMALEQLAQCRDEPAQPPAQ
jgi:hypothetical protein